ncbi:hypothetical protein [Methanobacterium petrolearium]|uniref:hypothetical protein n=1 Tax=Methanobacterium petrolearium TaxID=710190 RepID=UPI001AE6CBAF|nr:hypothetical protein [Methanobacterium petrolearium]MBP1946928.1 hypothetical protein [Methanobacterium petrolearium]
MSTEHSHVARNIKCHDMVADQAASEFNVTWSRTTPIVVSCCDDAASSYITGEMDHRMGMDVNGTASNVWAFRFACSSAFSPIEQEIGNPDGGAIGSVTMGIGERIINGETPELFYSNGYIIYKIKDQDDMILLLDPTTGIVRDVANGICAVYCYHNQITDNRIERAENLTSSDPNVRSEWLDSINNSTVSLVNIVLVNGTIFNGEVLPPEIYGPFLLPLMTMEVFHNLKPGIINETEIKRQLDIYKDDIIRNMDIIYSVTGNYDSTENYTPLAIYNWLFSKFFGNDYQKSTYSPSNPYIQEWANDIKGNYTLNTNYDKGQAVFNYVFYNVVTFWHAHNNICCPIEDVAKYNEANCAETTRIVYNLALASGIPKDDVRCVYLEEEHHYWVQIRCDGEWKDCDPSHAYTNNKEHIVRKFGDIPTDNVGLIRVISVDNVG